MKNHCLFFEQLLGKNGCLVTEEEQNFFLRDRRQGCSPPALCVVLPKNLRDVQRCVAYAYEHHLSIVSQGGQTGNMGGAFVMDPHTVLMNLQYCNEIVDVNSTDQTVTVQAGVILEKLQEYLLFQGLRFPLSLGSQGSCHIGGMLATNAGGSQALKYGMMRQLTQGIQVVGAYGKIYETSCALTKNNFGYDLKSLFIGSEGTLGCITQATLRVVPEYRFREMLFLGLHTVEEIVELYVFLRRNLGELLVAFEMMDSFAFQLALQYQGSSSPLFQKCPFEANYYLMIECAAAISIVDLREMLEDVWERYQKQLRKEIVVLMFSKIESIQKLWDLREGISYAQRQSGTVLHHDVGLPLSSLVMFFDDIYAMTEKILPRMRNCFFGHIGDGNIHLNFLNPLEMASKEFLSYKFLLEPAVFECVLKHKGTISAEHGIGRVKAHAFYRYSSQETYKLCRSIKKALDPRGLFNPSKIFLHDP